MNVTPPVFVITGQLSAGKSTIARGLLDRFEFGYHIDVDGIREMYRSFSKKAFTQSLRR